MKDPKFASTNISVSFIRHYCKNWYSTRNIFNTTLESAKENNFAFCCWFHNDASGKNNSLTFPSTKQYNRITIRSCYKRILLPKITSVSSSRCLSFSVITRYWNPSSGASILHNVQVEAVQIFNTSFSLVLRSFLDGAPLVKMTIAEETDN